MVEEVLKEERKTKKLKIIKMEVISKEQYLKIHYGDRHDYFRLIESKLKPMKFSIGDVIHTIDYHFLEDEQGNDIDQEIMFVNPNVITGEYKITDGQLAREKFSFDLPFDIALGCNYNLDTIVVDIDDFRYELIDRNQLKVNIDLYIDGEVVEQVEETEPISEKESEETAEKREALCEKVLQKF
jgi:uncharacterized protein YfkK (UPF0435 family)